MYLLFCRRSNFAKNYYRIHVTLATFQIACKKYFSDTVPCAIYCVIR